VVAQNNAVAVVTGGTATLTAQAGKIPLADAQAKISPAWLTNSALVEQTDIGTAPNEIPLNQYLGNLAYQDAANIAGPVGVGGALTLNSGTINGVTYLNGSKVLTTGSALTFDGSDLGVGGAPETGIKLKSYGAIAVQSAQPAYLRNSDNTNDVRISNLGPTGSGNGQMAWTFGGVGELMRLTSTGLGIGTMSPSVAFELGKSTATNQIRLKASNGNVDLRINSAFAGGDVAAMGVVSAHPLMFFTTNTERMRLDSAGNLGLGITPSAWGSNYKGFQISNGGGSVSGNSRGVNVNNNCYNDNTNWVYFASASAARYNTDGGQHNWFIAPSGTAGNAISFSQAMTLDASGLLLVGNTSAQAPTRTNGGAAIFGTTPTNGSGLFPGLLELTDTRAYNSTAPAAGGGISFGYKYNSGGTSALGPSIQGFKENTTDGDYAGALAFYTRANGSLPAERARIDSAGNLLLGTTSGTSRLSVVGGALPNAAYLGLSSGLAAGRLVTGNANNSTGVINYYNDNSVLELSAGTSASSVTGVVLAGASSNVDGSSVKFYTASAERARIDGLGNLLVGTTSTNRGSSGFHVSSNGQFFSSTNSVANLNLRRIISNGDVAIFTATSGSIVGAITIGTTTTTYNTSSDYRLKNITGPVANSGAYIDSLNPVEGTWKADGSTFVGLIAHEVQEASRTQVATGTKDGAEMQAMDYSNAELIANLIAEVKSLRARVAQLEAA
jgi:hypothetical protein